MSSHDFHALAPRKAPLAAAELEDGLALYDARSGSTHRLNAVAGFIWTLCDGTKAPDAIAAEVAARFGRSPAEIAGDVNSVLSQFADIGLVLSMPRGAEVTWLLRCVRQAIGTSTERPDDDRHDVDWNALVQLALDHGVMPLVERGLRVEARRVVPPIVLERLRSQSRTNCRVNVGFVRELLDVLAVFEAEGIRAFPLKGPVLAMTLYGHVGWRQFGDLDVFISPRDADRALDLAVSRGYEMRRRRKTDLIATKAHVTLDLQWALARAVYRFPLGLQDLWSGLERIRVAGRPVWQPSIDDYLVVLCAHGAKHGWSSLVWIADIAMIASKYQNRIDWTGLLSRTRRRGGERQLLIALRLAHDVLGAGIPADVLPRMRADGAVEAVAGELQRELFRSVAEPAYERSFLDRGLTYMRGRERLRDRIPYTAMLAKHLFLRATAQAG